VVRRRGHGVADLSVVGQRGHGVADLRVVGQRSPLQYRHRSRVSPPNS
jgi:hypothetical protein